MRDIIKQVRTGQLRRFVSGILMLACFSAAVGAIALFLVFRVGLAGNQPRLPKIPEVPGDRPLTILVRGWLWDPSSRRVTRPLVEFPGSVNEILHTDYGMETAYVQFGWTRIPKDVFGATERFAEYARRVAERARQTGVCVNFVGHSGGAMMIYWAAAEGVPMGFMGTLGLPILGTEKPPSVDVWANFYTETHIDDIAGWMWGRHIGSDQNIDLEIPHRDFWGASEVQRASADGIAKAWGECRSK